MRFAVFATDYDGTLARHGTVNAATLAALDRVRASGRSTYLVTGREIEDLRLVFPRFDLFDRIVAENGAALYHPSTDQLRALHEPPPPQFVQELRSRGVPIAIGRVIVASHEPHESVILDVIKHQGLELEIIFNKGAVMVLPSGVNKATGLRLALDERGLTPEQTVAVGDAENDHAFLDLCGWSVAVSNAVPSLKKRADWVTTASHGDGVVEAINCLIADDRRLPRTPKNSDAILK